MSKMSELDMMCRDEMDNYQGEGWTPSKREFLCGFSKEESGPVGEWYDANYPNGGHRGASLEDAVRWGDADPVLLDYMD
jgi:hypothetical protein